ncbi:MAG: polysaccharide biosynthesis C-terminal domain-containing protein [Candidatus Micrarchaeota archaeon]
MFKESAIAVGGMLAFVAINYFYHFAMVRLLPPQAYGVLGVLIGALVIITVPTATIQTIIARETAASASKGALLLRKYSRKSLAYGLALALLASLAAYFYYSGGGNFVAAALMALSIPLSYATAAALGFLQGKRRVTAFTAFNLAGPVVKVVLAAAFVLAGFGLAGAAGSVLLSSVLVLAPLLWFAGKSGRLPQPTEKIGSLRKSVQAILATNFVTTAFLYFDLFAVTMLLGSQAAGLYNVAGITSRVLWYVSTGAVVVLLPHAALLAKEKNSGKENGKKIRRELAIALLFMIPPFAAFALFPSQIIEFFYTPAYAAAAKPFLLLSLAMLFFGAFNLSVNALWARGEEKKPLAIALCGAALDLALLFFLVPAQGLEGAATATCVSSAAMLAPAAFYALTPPQH